MPGIRIDWTALEAAFENHDPQLRTYLDRASGELVVNPDLAIDGRELLLVEPVASREQYRMMEQFIETVTHEPLKQKLADSIVGKGAFRRFKDVVGRFTEERKRWFAFRDVLLHQYVLEWLTQQRVELMEMPDWTLDLPAPGPDAPVDATPELAEAIVTGPSTDMVELKSYLHAWARAHGEEYRFLFGPAAFERLAEDMTQEFALARRR